VEGWNFEAVACSSNKNKRTHRDIVGILKGSRCLWSWYLPDYISILLLDHKGHSGTGIRCKADSCLLHGIHLVLVVIVIYLVLPQVIPDWYVLQY
jgi:hypothetical protein